MNSKWLINADGKKRRLKNGSLVATVNEPNDCITSQLIDTVLTMAVSLSPTQKISYINNKIVKKYLRCISISKKLDARKTAAPDRKTELASENFKISASRLDYYIITTQKQKLEGLYQQCKNAKSVETNFGYLPDKSENNSYCFKRAQEIYWASRSEEWRFRILEELSQPGYPVFWTLTVDPENEYIIKRGQREFGNWLRKIRKKFGELKYCCVTERGENGRLHYHCLIIFEKCRFTDPNEWRPGGYREIPEMRGLWPYGLSNPIAIRYGPVDHFGKLGWRWPSNTKTGAPIAIALYMPKYLNKGTKDVNGCRTKMSKNFGLKNLQNLSLHKVLLLRNKDPDQIRRSLKLQSNPPQRLWQYSIGKILFSKQLPHTLPIPKAGSVRIAASIHSTRTSNRENAGDEVNLSGVYKGFGNSWKKQHTPLKIGSIV